MRSGTMGRLSSQLVATSIFEIESPVLVQCALEFVRQLQSMKWQTGGLNLKAKSSLHHYNTNAKM